MKIIQELEILSLKEDTHRGRIYIGKRNRLVLCCYKAQNRDRWVRAAGKQLYSPVSALYMGLCTYSLNVNSALPFFKHLTLSRMILTTL